MTVLVALVVGYLFGAKTGGRDLEQLSESVKALYDTDEFADVVSAARAQVANTLREVAGLVDGGHQVTDGDGDIVANVRNLVGRDRVPMR